MATAEETAAAEKKAADAAAAALTPEQKQIKALEAENATLLKETLAKKDQIKQLETQKQTEIEAQLKEQNKYKELYEGALPSVTRLKELEPVLTNLLELEVADVPDDKKELIPGFEKPEQKLLWVRNAKSKGLFGAAAPAAKVDPKTGKTIPATVQSKVTTDGTLPDYVSWDKNDPRVAKLTIPEYRIWKQHNTKASSGIKGWGG